MTLPNEISDLFFNHQHDHYSVLFHGRQKEMVALEKIREAISKDARDYAQNYFEFFSQHPSFPVTVPAMREDQFAVLLVDDFMSRI